MNVYVPDEQAMLAQGHKLAQKFQVKSMVSNKVIFLIGELGAGKTTLVRGFLRSLGYEGKVKSPTYTLVESYEFDGLNVHHFDFYRILNARELTFMDLADYFETQSICLIEWPEHVREVLPTPDITVYITVLDEGREVKYE